MGPENSPLLSLSSLPYSSVDVEQVVSSPVLQWQVVTRWQFTPVHVTNFFNWFTATFVEMNSESSTPPGPVPEFPLFYFFYFCPCDCFPVWTQLMLATERQLLTATFLYLWKFHPRIFVYCSLRGRHKEKVDGILSVHVKSQCFYSKFDTKYL